MKGKKEEREEHIKLLLDGETPGMEKRLVVRGRIEVAAFPHEKHIGGEERDGRETGGKFAKIMRHFEPDEGEGQTAEEDEEERREDAAGAAFIETNERESALPHFSQDDAGDQVAADDKEDVDTGVAARKGQPACELDARVEEDDRNDSERAQSVYFSSAFHSALRAF